MIIRKATPADMPAVHQLCWDYRALLVERSANRSEIVDAYYAEDDYAVLLDSLPEKHAKPDGAILVAEEQGSVIGCAMIHRIDETTCEIKRVFVAPEGRGQGAAKALVFGSMDAARGVGYQRMVLDTMVHLVEAINLYQQLGFTPADPYYDLDPRFADLILFMEHPL